VKAGITLTEDDIYKAIANYIRANTGISVDPAAVNVEVKSKQNYRSEWEKAAIRCSFEAPLSK
jgi:hypothetical protein